MARWLSIPAVFSDQRQDDVEITPNEKWLLMRKYGMLCVYIQRLHVLGQKYNETLLCFMVFIWDMWSPSHNASGGHWHWSSISITMKISSLQGRPPTASTLSSIFVHGSFATDIHYFVKCAYRQQTEAVGSFTVLSSHSLHCRPLV